MWSYYGTKTNIAKYYPAPVHNKIIEPFAGAAKYSLIHFENDVLLVDKYELIINIWKWLQICSKKDILSLPLLTAGENLNDYNFDCIEQRHFMGFIIGYGLYMPNNKASAGNLQRPGRIKHNIKKAADNLFKIKHWKFICSSYDELQNENATWFIDPPYQHGGHKYIHSNKDIDYKHLKKYCFSRSGQVIVCENDKADWMQFKHMVTQNAMTGINKEAIWSNLATEFDHVQKQLF